MLFRKKYIKILGWGKRAENDQKVNIFAFLGGFGGFQEGLGGFLEGFGEFRRVFEGF